MKSKTIVAVIGCGLIGNKRARSAREHPETDLRFVVDADKTRAVQCAKKYGGLWETDWRKAVRDPGVDLVVVSTPNHLHRGIACESLRNGKHVLVEKPMGRNLKETEQIFLCAVRSKRKVKAGFSLRYHPAIQKAH